MPAESTVTLQDDMERHSGTKHLRLVEAADTARALPGSIGRYTLCQQLAFGGMGAVHLAVLEGAAGFRRPVAIKHVHGYLEQRAARDELRQEAWLGSRVRHPNVVPVLDLVEAGGTLYLVMEFVLGETLARLLEKQTMPVAVAAAILGDVLQGLHAAHTASGDSGRALGIVHRDVSPQNILVGADGVGRILDFGVAKCLGAEEQLVERTEVGSFKGKLGYIAPEQLLSDPLDARVDIFAAGVVLWEALTRRRLFKGLDPVQMLVRLSNHDIPRPSAYNREVTPHLDAVVARALERSPEARFQSAEEFAEQLRIATDRAPAGGVARHVEKTATAAIAKQRFLLRCIQTPRRVSPPQEPVVSRRSAHEATDSTIATEPLLEPPRSARSARSPRRGSSRHEGRLNIVVGIGCSLLAGLVYCVWQPPSKRLEPPALRALALRPAPSEKRLGPPAPVVVAAAPTAASFGGALPASNAVEPEPNPPSKAAPRPGTSSKRRVLSVSSRCSPPYRIDSEGIRRIKRGCL